MNTLDDSPGRFRLPTAGVVAASVATVLVAQGVVGVVISALLAWSMGPFPAEFLGNLLQIIGTISIVAFALGVGLSLWVVAPVTRDLTVGATIGRGLIAAAIGAGFVVALFLLLEWIEPDTGIGALFAGSSPAFPWSDIGQAVVRSLHQGVGLFVRWAPIVVLIVLLAWMWLRKQLSRHEVAVDTAEV